MQQTTEALSNQVRRILEKGSTDGKIYCLSINEGRNKEPMHPARASIEAVRRVSL